MQPPPVIQVEPKSLTTQWGSEAMLSCKVDGVPSQVITYKWFKGDLKEISCSSAELRIPRVTCEDEGQYRCDVFNGTVKIGSDHATIHVQLGKLFLNSNQTLIHVGIIVQLILLHCYTFAVFFRGRRLY